MGQAKQRGSYELRKEMAKERDMRERIAKSELLQRRASPKHVALMGLVAAMAQVPNEQT